MRRRRAMSVRRQANSMLTIRFPRSLLRRGGVPIVAVVRVPVTTLPATLFPVVALAELSAGGRKVEIPVVEINRQLYPAAYLASELEKLERKVRFLENARVGDVVRVMVDLLSGELRLGNEGNLKKEEEEKRKAALVESVVNAAKGLAMDVVVTPDGPLPLRRFVKPSLLLRELVDVADGELRPISELSIALRMPMDEVRAVLDMVSGFEVERAEEGRVALWLRRRP